MIRRLYVRKELVISLLVSSVLIAPVALYSADIRVGDQPSVDANERVQDDLYIAGGSVSTAGSVSGDVFAGGGSVVVSGSVGGDINAGGGNVTLLSNAPDDVRVGGGTVVIQGSIVGDLFVGGGQVHISSSRIGGDVFMGGGQVRLDAPVGGDVRIGGGDVLINSAIAGNVRVEADQLTLGSSANISGNLTYRSPKELTKEEVAVVKGKVEYKPRAERAAKGGGIFFGIVSLIFLAKIVALFVAALLVGLIFRRYSRMLVETGISSPFAGFGRGLVTIIVLPIVSILLIASLLGAPLGAVGLLSVPILVIYSWILSPILLGTILHRWIRKRDVYAVTWKTILLGTSVFSVLGVVPIIGCIIQVVIMLVALGAALKLKWAVASEWR